MNDFNTSLSSLKDQICKKKKNGDMNNAVDEVDLIDVFLKDIFETINLSFQMFTTVFLNNNCYIFVLNSSLLWGLSCAL